MTENVQDLTLKSDFEKLSNKRSALQSYWEDYAGWTLAYLYSIDGDEYTEKQHDYQAVGAQAVNHLANKIVSVLFPPSRPFFQLDLSIEQKDQLREFDLSTTQIDHILALAEKSAMRDMAKSFMRTALLEAVKAIIVLGNSLLYFKDDKSKAQVYSVKDYVILRDMSGKTYKLITRDSHVVATLPQDIQNLVRTHPDNAGKQLDPDDVIHIFTGIEKGIDGRYMVWQEIDTMFRVPRAEGKYTDDTLPWIDLTWNLSRGNNYGTGLVEEYAGDFHTYSSLSEALVNLASIVADIKILVDPMGQTDVPTLNDSASGTFVYGNADDISYLQLEKFQDMKFLHDQMQTYARRIGMGFLFSPAATRDAERVTAEEIRRDANELEGSLGGVYGRLSEDLQLPIAIRLTKNVGDEFRDIEPTIITGMESLSRNSELDDILMFFRDLALIADLPQNIQDWLAEDKLIAKIGAARRVDYKDFLLEKVQVDAERKARQERENPQQPQPTPQPETL